MRIMCIYGLMLFLVPITVAGDELVWKGIYQGKDVYVQNPYSRQEKAFCTLSVFVNESEVLSNPAASAFSIPLSHLTVGDVVVIKIHYREGCAPRIVNPDAIKPVGDFKFLNVRAGKNSVSWLAQGELPGSNYTIERKASDDNWESVNRVQGDKGGKAVYTVPIKHVGGENIYRLKYEGTGISGLYSETFSYTFEETPITFYPSEATTKIYLSEETEYLITDTDGKKYKRGKGRIITIHNLEPGEYFLNYQDRSERFVKKSLD